MVVTIPDEYAVQFEVEEINSLKNAVAVLNTIIKEMRDKNCDTLEGGILESPVQFDLSILEETREQLRLLCNETPHTMY